MTLSSIQTMLGQHWIHEHNGDTVKYEKLVHYRDSIDVLFFVCFLDIRLCLSVTLHLFSVQTIVCFRGQRYESIILAGETQTYHGLSEVSDVSSC